MALSQKENRFISQACELARNSPCMQRHGAVAVLNGKVIGRGYNNKRTFSSDGFIHNCLTTHAEINALREAYYHFKMRGKYKNSSGKVVHR